MLELKNIYKSYRVGDFRQQALDGVSVSFRKKEFVTILGPSGCGKTTLLNIIGGLDRYDSGDLLVLGKSTKNFTDREWDRYRNGTIGFIFQNHNLIPHLSLLQNVEMGMALSGVPRNERHRRAKEVLEKVGLKEHIHKRPNQLSGGQSQRVAVARALVTDPDVILADEPTGSLDSVTSVQIMDLIREISREKLVIMVTHNADLALQYATRVIHLKDGKIVDDSNPVREETELKKTFTLKKTAMSLGTAFVSSLNNIRTKLGRTILTAFAGSIGIIGIALIQSFSTGLDLQIDQFQQQAIAEYPIEISRSSFDLTEMRAMMRTDSSLVSYPDSPYASVYSSSHLTEFVHLNTITEDYLAWVEDYAAGEGKNYIAGLEIDRNLDFSLIRQDPGADPTVVYWETQDGTTSDSGRFTPTFVNRLPSGSLLESMYDLLYGSLPVSDPDNGSFQVVLLVDEYNRIYDSTLANLGITGLAEGDQVSFTDLVGKTFQLYVGTYEAGVSDLSQSLDITISGVVRLAEDKTSGLFYNGIGLPAEAIEYIYDHYPEATGDQVQSISIYATDFDAKEVVKTYLDSYNSAHGYGEDSVSRIEYTDRAELISSIAKNMLDTISVVLIAFAAVSLVVSSIMIAIITYISVIERTKEIGVLRALGARKKDISRVFNSENLIIGFAAGLVGIGTAYLLMIPANLIIEHFASVPNVAHLNLSDALILIGISVFLAFLAGYIPARMASKKDPVIALRTE